MRATLRSRVPHVVVAALLALMALGPVNALQGLAWCGMLASRLATTPASVAVATTFDGAHPCELCRALDDARHHHDDSLCAHLRACVRAWLVAETPAVIAVATPRFVPRTRRDAPSLDGRRPSPPLPPPRA